jgi:uncharacterized protein
VLEQMQLLRELQELDQELNRVGSSRRKLEEEMASLQGELDRVQTMVDTLLSDLSLLRGDRNDFAQALAQEQENIKKAEGRLPNIKTQKEYVAVLKEIDVAKKMNKDTLDRIQAKDGEINALSREKEEKEGELSAIAERVAGRRADIDAALQEYNQTLDEKGQRREELLKKLPVPLRKRYLLLLDRRGGVAVVEARNGACLGCHMHLPPQIYNSLFTVQEVQSCPHCHRLLFVSSIEG